MKRLFIFLLLLSLIVSVVFAHPGRTDSNGGHWNRSTGEYHYHSGEYAGRSSSSSSSDFSHSYSKPSNSTTTKKSSAKTSKTAKTSKWEITFGSVVKSIFLLILCIISCAFYFVYIGVLVIIPIIDFFVRLLKKLYSFIKNKKE